MTDREKLRKEEKKVWKLLRKLYNKGYLISLGYAGDGYHFAFWSGKIHKPKNKI